eukprot:891598_1
MQWILEWQWLGMRRSTIGSEFGIICMLKKSFAARKAPKLRSVVAQMPTDNYLNLSWIQRLYLCRQCEMNATDNEDEEGKDTEEIDEKESHNRVMDAVGCWYIKEEDDKKAVVCQCLFVCYVVL